MSKPPFIYRIDKQARILRVALARAENGDTELLGRYFLEGGKTTDFEALGRALIASKARRGRPSDTSELAERAAAIVADEDRWRKANRGKRLPYGRRPRLVELHVDAAWLEHLLFELDSKRMTSTEKRDFEREYKDEVEARILRALENIRKNRPRIPRKKTR
jgi:hypothetical protein